MYLCVGRGHDPADQVTISNAYNQRTQSKSMSLRGAKRRGNLHYRHMESDYQLTSNIYNEHKMINCLKFNQEIPTGTVCPRNDIFVT